MAGQAAGLGQGEGKHKQTETAAFKNWFGDSKVVDKDGDPKVVFHGTKGNFNEFEKGKTESGAIFMSSSPHQSNEFAGIGNGVNILPVYAKIENPLQYNWQGKVYSPKKMERVMSLAKEKGHDGVIHRNIVNFEGGSPSTSYAVFNPNQIKSASGNRGTFDPNSNLITHVEISTKSKYNQD